MNDFKQIACDLDCRFVLGGSQTTLMGWSPAYDKYGNQLNRDPNTTTTEVKCITCVKVWAMTTRDGDPTTYRELKR